MNSIRQLSRQKTQKAGREILLEYRRSLPWHSFRLKSKLKRAANNPLAALRIIEQVDDRVGPSPRAASTSTISQHSRSLNSLAAALSDNGASTQESFLDRLLRVFQWILDNKDQIREIIDWFS